MSDIETMPLIAAAKGGDVPFVGHPATVFTGWLKDLGAVIADGSPTEAEMRSMFALMHELAQAADLLAEHEAQQARSAA